MKIDITADEYNTIKQVLNNYLRDCNVYVFGSRAKNTARINSDLDLALESISGAKIASTIIIDLKEAFNNSNLPYGVDIIDLNNISNTFRTLINQEKKIFPLKSIGTKSKFPKLRFKADDGSDYPDWEEKRLGDIARRITRKNDVNNTNVLTISAQHGLINQEDFFHKQIASKDLSGYTLLKNGEFAYNKSYSKWYPLGVIKRLNLYDQGVLSVLYICFALENVSLDFYMYYFESGILNQQIYKIAQEGARNHGLLNISATDFFTDIFVYLPYSLEQQKIADFLTSVDELITHTKQHLELMKQYKQGIMQQIFSQKLRFKADDGSDYPAWEESRLGEVAKINMGQSPSSYYYNDCKIGLPLIQGNADSVGKLSNPRIFTSSITKICNIGDILMSVRAPAGIIFKSVHKACIGRGICSIQANNFVYQYLLQHETSWKKYSQGSAFDSLNSDQIKNLQINIPSLHEQQKIANFLTTIDNNIQQQTTKLEQTELYKKALLQQMLV